MKRVQKSVMTVIAASLLSSTPVWAAAQEAVLSGKQAAEQTAPAVSESKAVEQTTVEEEVSPAAIEQPEMSQAVSDSLDLLYRLVPELKELELKEQHYSPADEQRPATWILRFSNEPDQPEQDSRTLFAYAYVSIEAQTGKVLSFDMQHPEWASNQYPSDQQAIEAATAFMKQLLGDELDDYQRNEQVHYTASGYRDDEGNEKVWSLVSVQFNRLINGIPLLDHGYQVAVDAAGRVNSVYSLTQGLNEEVAPDAFPEPSKALTEEEAKQKFRELLDMELVYRAYGPNQPMPLIGDTGTTAPAAKPILQYVPRFSGFLDAVSGKEVNYYGFVVDEQQMQKDVKLQPEGDQLVARNAEEAEEVLTEGLGIDMSGLVLTKSQDADLPSQQKYLYYSWHSEQKPDPTNPKNSRPVRYAHLVTDAETGQVLSVFVHDEAKRGAKAEISREEAEKKAIAFLQKYVAADVAELMLRGVYSSADKPEFPDWVDVNKIPDMTDDLTPEISFHFCEVHEGIPIVDRSYLVTIDPVTGSVSGFSFPPEREGELTLPDPSDVVTPEEAADALLEANPPKLVYLWPDFAGQRAPAPLLLYVSDFTVFDGSYLDATTGKWVKPATGNE
ncbi:YcdB/YcdC domain-containing protein [Brevibacillus marinus]|uniref:YcdB/YcdC domain-containing protein n=1 Tax=Brevibacillus marinus TaxID=2496837 RepID=UPI000F81A15B|nr:YcdB/YcdC domain-containing protein [Brevibacillus marinus]